MIYYFKMIAPVRWCAVAPLLGPYLAIMEKSSQFDQQFHTLQHRAARTARGRATESATEYDRQAVQAQRPPNIAPLFDRRTGYGEPFSNLNFTRVSDKF